LGASSHAANAEAKQAAALDKAVSIVFNLQASNILAVFEPNGEESRMRMPDRVGNGFLADAVKGVHDPQWHWPFVAFSF
jgi:hypothetical protein